MSNQSNFAANAVTFNQLNVATYIDNNSTSPALQPLVTALNTLTVPQQRLAFDEMTAQVNGTLAQSNVQNSTFMYQMLRRRVGSGFAASGVAGGGGGGGGGGYAAASGSGNSSSTTPTIVPVSYTTSTPPAQEWSLCRARASRVPLGAVGPRPMAWEAMPKPTVTRPAAPTVGGTIFATERALDENNLFGLFGAYSNLNLHLAGLPQTASGNQGQLAMTISATLARPIFWRPARSALADIAKPGRWSLAASTARPPAITAAGPRASIWNKDGPQVGRTMVQPYAALNYI